MDWIFAHLVVNHFPIILAVVASLAAVVAAVSGRDGAWRYAIATGLLAAVAAPIAFLTGQQGRRSPNRSPASPRRRSRLTSTGGCTR
jgi:hypothetical protein